MAHPTARTFGTPPLRYFAPPTSLARLRLQDPI
ncbi:UNVERIFIED_CONTAM: hypothetical protein GTU68_058119 [Idotea baltica]|nr:hypothetical protein [Idotea baltica]